MKRLMLGLVLVLGWMLAARASDSRRARATVRSSLSLDLAGQDRAPDGTAVERYAG